MFIQNKRFTFFLGRTRTSEPPFKLIPGAGNWKVLSMARHGSDCYRLVKVVSPGGYYTTFHIQHMEVTTNRGEWTFIRTFSDKDVEYAENCAREAFHYLTEEI